jgi:hypothetical protein
MIEMVYAQLYGQLAQDRQRELIAQAQDYRLARRARQARGRSPASRRARAGGSGAPAPGARSGRPVLLSQP